MSIEAMKQALKKAFNLGQTYWHQADSENPSYWKKADATKAEFEQLVEDTCQAIAEAEKQEPVAWQYISNFYNPDKAHGRRLTYNLGAAEVNALPDTIEPLYTHPQPKCEWVGLTDEERDELMDNYDVASPDYAKAIEAKLKEKNK